MSKWSRDGENVELRQTSKRSVGMGTLQLVIDVKTSDRQ